MPQDFFGMEALGRVVGLDIDKIALDLALKDDGTKPIECVSQPQI